MEKGSRLVRPENRCVGKMNGDVRPQTSDQLELARFRVRACLDHGSATANSSRGTSLNGTSLNGTFRMSNQRSATSANQAKRTFRGLRRIAATEGAQAWNKAGSSALESPKRPCYIKPQQTSSRSVLQRSVEPAAQGGRSANNGVC